MVDTMVDIRIRITVLSMAIFLEHKLEVPTIYKAYATAM